MRFVEIEMDVASQFGVVVVDAGIEDRRENFVFAVAFRKIAKGRRRVHASRDFLGNPGLVIDRHDALAAPRQVKNRQNAPSVYGNVFFHIVFPFLKIRPRPAKHAYGVMKIQPKPCDGTNSDGKTNQVKWMIFITPACVHCACRNSTSER